MSVTVQNKMIWIYKDDRLCEMSSLTDAMELSGAQMECLVVSAVGSGGKTTTLHRIADEFVRQGQQVIVTTTTRILEETVPYFLKADPADLTKADPVRLEKAVREFSCRLKENLNGFGQVWTGMTVLDGKLCSLPDMLLEQVWKLDVPVLIEADGARKMPLKVPAGHEPVIHPRTTHVLSVYGLDAVGERLGDVCFRKELAEKILKKGKDERVTPMDIASLASSPAAGRKGCPDHAVYTVILNKADSSRRREDALDICRMLREKGIGRVLISSYTRNGKM